MKEAIRTHILLPRPLVEEVDALVGPRARSRFVEEAIAEKLTRERQLQALRALRQAGGVLRAEDHPEWATPEKTSQWVHDLRRQADEHLTPKLGPEHDAAPA